MSPVIPSQSSPRTGTLAATFTPMQPSRSISSSTLPIINSSIHTSSYGNGKPNYDITPQTQVQPNLSLFSSIPTIQPSIPSIKSSSIIVENVGNGMQSPIQWKTPILKPKVVKKSKKEEFGDWKDFDPIK